METLIRYSFDKIYSDYSLADDRFCNWRNLIGVSTAWVTSAYDFKGKTLLSTLLTLPLAMPAYLMAYVWTDLLEYAGPFQNSLRSFFLWKSSQDYWFPEIRSLGGAIFLFSFVLYPYIFFWRGQLSRTMRLRHFVSVKC